jgi:hypothetical protein
MTDELADAVDNARYWGARAEKAEAEVERLQGKNEMHEKAWRDAEAEVEGLRKQLEWLDPLGKMAVLVEENERLRARADGTCSKHDDRCHDRAVSAEQEVERLRGEVEYHKVNNAQYQDMVTKVERLEKALAWVTPAGSWVLPSSPVGEVERLRASETYLGFGTDDEEAFDDPDAKGEA